MKKSIKTFIKRVYIALGIMSWIGTSAMLIKLSTCPTFGYFFLTVPFALAILFIGTFFYDQRKEWRDIIKAAKPFPKASKIATRNNNNSQIA